MTQVPAEIFSSYPADVSPSSDPDLCIDGKALAYFPFKKLVLTTPYEEQYYMTPIESVQRPVTLLSGM